jgi:Copper amine oxidase, enzyme domain
MPDGPANPFGVGFCATETVLKTEQQAQRNGNPAKSRIWKVKNPSSLNRMNGAQLCAFASWGLGLYVVLCMVNAGPLACSNWSGSNSSGILVLDRTAGGLEAGTRANATAVCQPQQLAPPPWQICHQGEPLLSIFTVQTGEACCAFVLSLYQNRALEMHAQDTVASGCAAPVGDAICGGRTVPSRVLSAGAQSGGH